jgi:arylsulfatase
VFNLRGDDGATTGGLAVDTNLGWKGAEKYVAIVPQVFDRGHLLLGEMGA